MKVYVRSIHKSHFVIALTVNKKGPGHKKLCTSLPQKCKSQIPGYDVQTQKYSL